MTDEVQLSSANGRMGESIDVGKQRRGDTVRYSRKEKANRVVHETKIDGESDWNIFRMV